MLVKERPEEQAMIEGNRVKLVPLDPGNIYRHFEWSNDPDLNRLQSEIPFEEETFGVFKRRFEQLIETPAKHERHFEIHTSEGKIIGVAFIGRINEHNRNCLLSITIGDREYWGEGYGKDAMAALLRHCFEDMRMHRVSTETFEYSDAWRRLVESVGFEREGTAREYLYRDGKFWDKSMYGLLESEYAPGREEG
jgi:RimJ/RimL family protein N-acetyltransferase